MKRLKLLLITIILGSLAFPLRAEEEATVDRAGPVISFREAVYDAGETWEGESISHIFTFTNIGDAELKISRVRTTCGCTASNLSSDTIAPGESGEIRATFNTRGYRGRTTQPVFIHSNDRQNPTARVEIVTTIKTVAAFDPRNVQFGRVVQGQPAVREVSVVFDGDPVRVLEISAQPEFFSARIIEPEEPESAGPVRIEVTLSPEAPVGRHRGGLTARIDHPRMTSLTGRLLATVEGLIQHQPRMLFFNENEQSRRIEKYISLVNRAEQPVEIREVRSDVEVFQVEVDTVEPGKEFEISVRLRPDAAPGHYSGQVTIETDLPGQNVILVPLRSNISR